MPVACPGQWFFALATTRPQTRVSGISHAAQKRTLSVRFASWASQPNKPEYSGAAPRHPRCLIGEALDMFVSSFMDSFIVNLLCDSLRAKLLP